MAQQVHPPRGMRDMLPLDKAKREQVISIIRSVYRQHGFDELETPVCEDWSRLHAGLGGDNEKLSFSVLKRGITAEQLEEAAKADSAEMLADLGLRFDLTVPLARFYASHRSDLPPVFRALQIAPVWRAERPQKGRYRQFMQADIDVIGEPGNIAEIELITATSHALAELGLDQCTIRVNDRRLLNAMLQHSGFAPESFERALVIIDKLDKIGLSGVTEELSDIDSDASSALAKLLAGESEREVATTPLTFAGIASALPAVAELPEIEPVIHSLASIGESLSEALPDGVSVVFDPTLVRGMGYYTATIFEIAHPSSGSSIGGGGRYDGMIGRFLGQNVPAVGFSLGFERIIDLVQVAADEAASSIALLCETDVTPTSLIALKRELIARGYRVRVEMKQKNVWRLRGFARA